MPLFFVGNEDDSESESEAVAAITNAIRPSRLATQVEQLGKQIETLKLQLAATNNGRTYLRSHANAAVRRPINVLLEISNSAT